MLSYFFENYLHYIYVYKDQIEYIYIKDYDINIYSTDSNDINKLLLDILINFYISFKKIKQLKNIL